MSHPKNTTAPSPAQLPGLNQMEFGDLELQGVRLFTIQEGVGLIDGLRFAADIGEGVHQLANRLAASINDGELAYLSEVRALAFLGEVASTLTRASQYALQKMGEQP
ncbi:hypothetical protein [Pseudomonas mosselii]|uniref:hypothetical protein n=1 Tax=Pseudomonas mosselii TaxID=78327 RepID=UPI003D2D570C